MTTVTIVELFPEHLAVNGDMGNVTVLRERLRLAGFDVEHVPHNPGDTLPASADFVTIGTGPVSALRVLETAVAGISERLREWRDSGVPMLAVTGGLQLLGRSITVPGAASVSGAGVFDIVTDATVDRVVTNCFVVDTAEVGRLIGFENHGSHTRLGESAVPFGTAATGRGNDGIGGEGVRVGNAIGTHLQGPVLAMNPALADHLIDVAMTRRGEAYETGEGHARFDALALECRRILARSANVPVSGPVG